MLRVLQNMQYISLVLYTSEFPYSLVYIINFAVFLDCNCQTVTLSLSGSANAELSFLSGNYQESVMTNGHQSWINADYAIWFDDVSNDWVVGPVDKRGTHTRWIEANNQGSKCPFDITVDWYLYYNSEWNLAAEASFACSQHKA